MKLCAVKLQYLSKIPYLLLYLSQDSPAARRDCSRPCTLPLIHLYWSQIRMHLRYIYLHVCIASTSDLVEQTGRGRPPTQTRHVAIKA